LAKLGAGRLELRTQMRRRNKVFRAGNGQRFSNGEEEKKHIAWTRRKWARIAGSSRCAARVDEGVIGDGLQARM
jgi:hypothetical protein